MKMLEYVKMILNKVSFDPYLFERELQKAATRLYPTELPELKTWCFSEFSDRFSAILTACFRDFPEKEKAVL